MNLTNPSLLSLVAYMQENFSYGYKNKFGNIIPEHKISPESFFSEYILQSPFELSLSKTGVCWDQAEFTRFSLLYLNILPSVTYIVFNNPNKSTHTFVSFQLDNKHFWIENAFHPFKGIHKPFPSKHSLILNVINNMKTFSPDLKPFSPECFDLSFKPPKPHSSAQDYMSFASSQPKIPLTYNTENTVTDEKKGI